MTKFKIYRINMMGQVTVEIKEAFDWSSVISMNQYSGSPIFKIEAYSGDEPLEIK